MNLHWKLSANYMGFDSSAELLLLFQGRLEKQKLSTQKSATHKESLDVLFVP